MREDLQKQNKMIDKILFTQPVTMFGSPAYGLLLFTPYENEGVVRLTGIDKKNHAFDGDFIDLPLDSLDKLRKVLQRIIKGDYEKVEEIVFED